MSRSILPITQEVMAHEQLNFGGNGGVLVIPFERLDSCFKLWYINIKYRSSSI